MCNVEFGSVQFGSEHGPNGPPYLVALLVASRAAEFAKPWKSEGSATLALPSVIQHSPVQNLFCMTNAALAVPLIRPRNVL